MSEKHKILVLGGTGFLGSKICSQALLRGHTVVALSRNGKQYEGDLKSVDWRTGNATDTEVVENILEEGGFTAVVHSIGALLDSHSGWGSYNKYFSGSKSSPSEGDSYDKITRITAETAVLAVLKTQKKAAPTASTTAKTPIPFIFISAAEAGWPDMNGGAWVEKHLAPKFLQRYLLAKRSVENMLVNKGDDGLIRPVIFRPSIIWSWDHITSMVPLGPFWIANKMGVPFVDRPVKVDSLAKAVVTAVENEKIVGVQRYKQIDFLELGRVEPPTKPTPPRHVEIQ